MNVQFEGNITYVDERFNMIISELEPNSILRIELNLMYSWSERPHFSYAVFKADSTGTVNLEAMVPIEGSYKFMDSMGLFYGLNPLKGYYNSRCERDFTQEYITCKYCIRSDKDEKFITITRRFTSVSIKCLHEYKRFRGDYYYHSDKKNSKCVIFLGGSEGKINLILPAVACLANKGFNVLALQYFDPEEKSYTEEDNFRLKNSLGDIPIEYIHNAVNWLLLQNSQNQVYIYGYSKGAELALLSASYNKNIKKVVAISPSAYVFEGINTFTSSWSLDSKSLPYIRFFPFIPFIEYLKNMIFSIFNFPQGYFLSYEISRLFSIYKEKKRIKVENVDGSICLVAGSKDRMWNSKKAVEIFKKTLCSTSHNNKYLLYKNAGHLFEPPFIFKPDCTFGGNKYANYTANEDSWKEIIDFLSS